MSGPVSFHGVTVLARLEDKVATVEQFQPDEAYGWFIVVAPSLGREWQIVPERVTLRVPALDDLELARFIVAEKQRARQFLRELVVATALEFGLPRTRYLRPATLTPAQQQRHAEEAADERRWSRAD